MRRLLAMLLGLAALAGSTRLRADLFRDDFARFPPGWLSAPVGQLNGAIQEYHFLPHRGVPLGPWFNPIVYQDAWVAGDEDGRPFVEQHLVNEIGGLFQPLFVTGEPEWRDYTVSAEVRPLSLADQAGLAFRYRTSRHYYLFTLEGGKSVRLALRRPIETGFRVPEWRELGRAPFAYDTTRYYTLRVENEGSRIRGFVDDKLVVEATDAELAGGRTGLTATMPARFRDFRVFAPRPVERAIAERIAARDAELAALRAANPRPVVWRKFETPAFGAGRNVRFGDLDGDGRLDMLIAQNIPRVRGDAFDHISCLTAVTLEGRVLWQVGRPDPRNGLLTNDTPFQIHDLDGDGSVEVVLVKDFKLQVLEGRTGKLLRSVFMPLAPAENKERPYELNNGDSMLFLDLSGKGRRQEILIKDRYRSFWIFDAALRLLWKGDGQTGHYPFPLDVDGDGRDEFQIGYALWDAKGRPRWSRDADLRDHADAISVGNFSGDPKARPRVYICGSDEGFLVFEADGTPVRHVRIGHVQTQSVGRFVPDRPGLQIFVANFWKNPGIVTLFDHDGQTIEQGELISGSSHLAPVNWRGDGQEFALLSSSVREGGMIDGSLRRVVVFPDDGHPELAYHVANVTGDARDEVIVWDQQRVWIYTQDTPFTGARLYAPTRNPTYNDSNYRATVSLPGWAGGSGSGGPAVQ
jgi:hypothetical protein